VISTQRRAIKYYPYDRFGSRFEGATGTNPEGLLAAAYAACFTLTLAPILDDAFEVSVKAGALPTFSCCRPPPSSRPR
jgi:organic hydroperoxide reductase OsmC/OhrA